MGTLWVGRWMRQGLEELLTLYLEVNDMKNYGLMMLTFVDLLYSFFVCFVDVAVFYDI